MTHSGKSPAEVDFATLILGFSSAALSYLGFETLPSDQGTSKNLVLAKQNIDIIDLLKLKTQGNLSPEEAQLLDKVLADLQTRYVDASRSETGR